MVLTASILAQLTPEEEKRLAELERRAGITSQSQQDLFNEEDASRLAELEKRAGIEPATNNLLTPAGLNNEEVNKRLSMLKSSRTPSKVMPKKQQYPYAHPQADFYSEAERGVSTVEDIRKSIAQKNQAYQELLDMGMSQEQIEAVYKTQKALEGPRTGRMVGGTVGGIASVALAGRLIPGPFDDAGLAAALIAGTGAGAGGVAGEMYQTYAEEKRFIDRYEGLKAFGSEFLTELGGRGIAKGLKYSPFVKKTAEEATVLMDDFAKFGGHFSPADLDKRFLVRVGEGFARGSFGAQAMFEELAQQKGAASIAYADAIVDSILHGAVRESPEKITLLFADSISPHGRLMQTLDDLFDPLYVRLDDVASQRYFRSVKGPKGRLARDPTGKFRAARQLQAVRKAPRISTDNLKKFAAEHLKIDKRLNGQYLSPAGRNLFRKIVGHKKTRPMADALSFGDWRKLRSSYLKTARKLGRDADTSEGLLKQLVSLTDEAVTDPKVGKQLSGEAKQLWLNIRSLYSASQKALAEDVPESLAKRLLDNPSLVTKELFPSNALAIRKLRKTLVEPISGRPSEEGRYIWNQLRQIWLADVVEESTKEGVANPTVFNKILRKYTRFGTPTKEVALATGGGKKGAEIIGETGSKALREIFPEKEVYDSVKRLQSLFEIAGKKPVGGFSLFARGQQLLGLKKMYDGQQEGDFVGFTVGAALALGPYTIARLSLTKGGTKLLTMGFKAKPGAKQAVPNAIRIIKFLRKQDIRDFKERNRIERMKRSKGRLEEYKKDMLSQTVM